MNFFLLSVQFLSLLLSNVLVHCSFIEEPHFSRQKCDRIPTSFQWTKDFGDGGFRIKIINEAGKRVKKYEFGTTYEVVIENWLHNIYIKSFELFAVQLNSEKPLGNYLHNARPLQTRNKRNCPGVATSTYPGKYRKISLRWEAPYHSKFCVKFLATVIPDSSQAFWNLNRLYYKDEGKLRLVLCPEFQDSTEEEKRKEFQSDESYMPVSICQRQLEPTLRTCCACDTAIYQMTVEMLWTRQYHWRDWPGDRGIQANWSTIIGASHSKDYFIWHSGGVSSSAVTSLCAFGDSKKLETELREQSNDNILTIIKARGVQNINLAEKRSALVAVNQSHHLVSFLTQMSPSPDWCTGLSALSLCSFDTCQWMTNQTIDLYPWDIGVRAGRSYLPPNGDTSWIYQSGNSAPSPICEITTTWPIDNPFTKLDKDNLHPVARVTFELMRINKDNSCRRSGLDNQQKDQEMFYRHSQPVKPKNQSPVDNSPEVELSVINCNTTPWRKWTDCSCKSGRRIRTREFVDNRARTSSECKQVSLKEEADCSIDPNICGRPTQPPPPAAVDSWSADNCIAGSWVLLSPCNATCNERGQIVYKRHFYTKSADPGRRDRSRQCEQYHPTHRYEDCSYERPCNLIEECTRAQPLYSDKCLKRYGQYVATRYIFNATDRKCQPYFYISKCNDQILNYDALSTLNPNSLIHFKNREDCDSICVNTFNQLPPAKRNYFAKKQWADSQRTKFAICWLQVSSGRFCSYGHRLRYYYEHNSGKCKSFTYFGCSGNANNFKTFQECHSTCAQFNKNQIEHSSQVYLAQSDHHQTVSDDVSNNVNEEKTSCEFSEWSAWSGCSDKCSGHRARTRTPIRSEYCTPTDERKLSEQQSCASSWNDSCTNHKSQKRLPCLYTEWSGWTACSKTCGRSIKERRRNKLPGQSLTCLPARFQYTLRRLCRLPAC